MHFKENVLNFLSILALLHGPIAWPFFARGPLIEDPWSRTTKSRYNAISSKVDCKSTG